jgi:hypothetical protein
MNNQLKTPSQLVESTEFLAWCGKWFGGDSDEEYLARAVAELYLPAILAAPPPAEPSPQPVSDLRKEELLQAAFKFGPTVNERRGFERGFAAALKEHGRGAISTAASRA